LQSSFNKKLGGFGWVKKDTLPRILKICGKERHISEIVPHRARPERCGYYGKLGAQEEGKKPINVTRVLKK